MPKNKIISKKSSLDVFDHRSIGNQLNLFMFDSASPGMAFWLPAGAQLRKRLDDIMYNAHKKRGYQAVLSPAMMEDTMWKISGHYDNYKENMFPSKVEKRDYLLKPMNCPAHIIMYQKDVVSYKDLPKRYFEFGQVHRNETAGSLHGLFRVREFTQDDLHAFITPEQVKDEIIEHLNFINSFLKTFNFEYKINLSTRPEKSIGSDKNWDLAENAIKSALKEINQKYEIDKGGAAFYGPKIDIKIKDKHGREWQLSTIQVDYNLPERFKMTYIDKDGSFKRPIMIHRAVMGSFERMIGILLEHYEGALPIWLSPYQVAIVPVSVEDEDILNYCEEIKSRLTKELNLDIILYNDNNTLNKRIKVAEQMKNPIVMIIGKKEVFNKTVNLRHKRKLKRYDESLEQFIENLKEEMKIEI